MSVEALTITAIIEEGTAGLRKAYQAGVTVQDFPAYEEEFEWVERRVSQRKPINARVFRQKFPDFDWLVPREEIADLFTELKNERAFMDLNTLIKTVTDDLDVENAVDRAVFLRDQLSEVTRLHSPTSDILLVSGWQDHIAEQKQLRALHKAGSPPGVPTDLLWIDHHWDGLVNGRMVVVLGRPGEGKTFLVDKFVWAAAKHRHRALLISPEMSAREHRCRIHTLASAEPEIKKACGLERSFRNRALMYGMGYNMKKYQRFCEYLSEEYGEIILLSGKHRKEKMTPAFVEAKINDLAPDVVIVDPIYKLKAPRFRESPIHELSDISDAIQDLSESYNIPVVVTNQAHRQGTQKDDAPHKDRSFNSDVPIQEADHVIGVKYLTDEHRLIVRCSKSRFGEEFRFEMKFYPNTGVMKETSDPRGNYYNGRDDPEGEDEEELKKMVELATKTEVGSG